MTTTTEAQATQALAPRSANGTTEVARLPGSTLPPQFARGFEGMATEAFPEAARKVLAEGVNPHDVEIKPDGIVFLPGVAYRRILTRAFGAGGWALAPRSPSRVMGNIVVYHGALFCLGRFVAEAVGECFYREGNSNMSYASCVEGAKTDALSRCCKDLGVATEMWDANWREKWKAEFAYRDPQDKTKNGDPKWKLKNRVSSAHDLMAGAGGVDPATGPGVTYQPPKGQVAGIGPSASSTPAPATGTTTQATPDTGEPLGPEAIAAIRAEVKRLKWKPSYARLWLKDFFGFEAPTALSRMQGDAALVLLQAHGTTSYNALVVRMQGEGRIAS